MQLFLKYAIIIHFDKNMHKYAKSTQKYTFTYKYIRDLSDEILKII